MSAVDILQVIGGVLAFVAVLAVAAAYGTVKHLRDTISDQAARIDALRIDRDEERADRLEEQAERLKMAERLADIEKENHTLWERVPTGLQLQALNVQLQTLTELVTAHAQQATERHFLSDGQHQELLNEVRAAAKQGAQQGAKEGTP